MAAGCGECVKAICRSLFLFAGGHGNIYLGKFMKNSLHQRK